MSENGGGPESPAERKRAFQSYLRSRHPPFLIAVISDARVVSANRGRSLAGASRAQVLAVALRLAWESDAFLAQALYRAKARLQGLGVPVLPRILHRLSIAISQICIGDPVVIEAGVHIAHGQIVVDGITEVGKGSTIFPHTTIGLTAGQLFGPKIGRNVTVGSGAKVIGHVTVGAGARIGANAVVVNDVPPETTVTGVPAKVVRERSES